MTAGALLDYLVGRGCKVVGVQITGTTPVVQHDPAATDADKAFTASELAAATEAAVDAASKDAVAASLDSNALIQAVAQLDFEERQKLTVKAGQTLLTAAQCKARVKAIYRGLL